MEEAQMRCGTLSVGSLWSASVPGELRKGSEGPGSASGLGARQGAKARAGPVLFAVRHKAEVSEAAALPALAP